jgi:hypothetical protein
VTAHPLEYNETPEGRISAEALEIVRWMFEEQRKRDPQIQIPGVPDFRDMYDHLKHIIRVEMLKQLLQTESATLQDSALRRLLSEAEENLAVEREMRATWSPRGEFRRTKGGP